jgi:AraC family transcriptional regulator of adaptative response / DNA-3-methyladenine glycosylase II
VIGEDEAYAALRSRDGRFDGRFVVAVATTGIYCRPSCPAALPRRENVRFFPAPAAAQQAGYRACKRCRPDATPGSPEWNARADVVGRAMRLIADGLVDREGVTGLAARLGYSERQLHRQLVAEVGAGPQALARAHRARTARLLLETTTLPMDRVAYAAGFTSIRQFNHTISQVFAVPPTRLRATTPATAPPGALTLRLTYRPPLAARALFHHLATHALPAVEQPLPHAYRRSLHLPHGPAVLTLHSPTATGTTDRHDPAGVADADPGYLRCDLHLAELADLPAAVQRCRRLLDLDADPQAVAAHLVTDPLLAPLVAAAPGRRVPGHPDPFELVVRSLVADDPGTLAHLVRHHGRPLPTPVGTVTHLFPTPEDLLSHAPDADLLPGVIPLVRAIADGSLELDADGDRDAVERQLLALPGISPTVAALVRMRTMGDPDAFPTNDPGVRQALARLGVRSGDRERVARRWRPWRSYAVAHLWAGTVVTGRRVGTDGGADRAAGTDGAAGVADAGRSTVDGM